MQAATKASADTEVEFEPANGSWVAELEEAKALLAEALRTGDPGVDCTADGSNEALLDAYLRLCRAHSMLREWERLSTASKKGLAQCSTLAESSSNASVPWFESSFRTYRKQARDEISAEMNLGWTIYEDKDDDDDEEDDGKDEGGSVEGIDERVGNKAKRSTHGLLVLKANCRRDAIKKGIAPDLIQEGDSFFTNTNVFQDAALNGDARLMEMFVSLGSAIDFPFRKVEGVDPTATTLAVPHTASALVMVCMLIAIHDSTNPAWTLVRMAGPQDPAKFERLTECAMQLVRLGADPNRRLELFNMSISDRYFVPDLHGKTAFQVAAMTKRRPLVALMLEHMRLSPEERAEVVHCRCGSRLPWKKCHSTGTGQPPHYVTAKGRTHYRVSPLARCPCGNAAKTYHTCCWSDNRTPKYLDDKTGFHYSSYHSATTRTLERFSWSMDEDDPLQKFIFLRTFQLEREHVKECTRRFRESQFHFWNMCAEMGPKSKMGTWDRFVYIGCVERLDFPFLWMDLHAEHDRSELLRLARDWNQALEKYCDDLGLVGEARARIVERHTANPCGPCGFHGCDAFETRVREFERCSKCKQIAYCSRGCQKKDWANHKDGCVEPSAFSISPVLLSLPGVERESVSESDQGDAALFVSAERHRRLF
jgi:MYND finger